MIKNQLIGLIISLRPRQWTKNFFLAALLFSKNFLHLDLLLLSIAAVALFCGISGATYLLNDLLDIKADRHHPVKAKRPIASGQLSVPFAITTLILLVILTFLISFQIGMSFFITIVGYFLLQIAYSSILKKIVILDVLGLTAGFVLRVYAGAAAIHVEISTWLILCSFLLSLFMALGKRRHELTLLGEKAGEHRKVLNEYSHYLLDQMIAVVTASTVIAYALYTLSEQTIAKFGTNKLILTVPFVIYGIFRYLYLVHMKKEGGSPETLLVTDLPFLINITLWIIASGIIIYK